MKKALASGMLCLLCVSLFAGDMPEHAKKPVRQRERTPATNGIASELKSMKDAIAAQQAQIEQLRQEVLQRDQTIQQTSQEVEQLKSAAATAQAKAEAADATATEGTQAVKTLRSDVTDIKANSASAAATLQETQKRVGELETPLALRFKGITITPGGFVAAESVWRQRGTLGGINSPFTSIPFPGSDTFHTSEFFGSGRQSRLSLLAEGKLKNMKLSGYWEMDWLGTGITSNNNQSNSYVNRQRQLWGQVAFKSGWTFTGGQMWSLVTETRKGLENRTEALPMTIDPQYHVGFSWARQYGLRVTKSFNKDFFIGLSLENPQTTFSAANAPVVLIGGPGNGAGLYNATANYSENYLPDFVGKVAFEPGAGQHYEIFGVLSSFRDRIYPNAGATPASAAGAHNYNATGGGVGANARVTVHKVVDIGAHFLGGSGVGRYGTTSLPDATVRPDGTLALLRSWQGLGTLELHTKSWDWYFNAGEEYVGRGAYPDAAGRLVGYGIPTAVNTGCSVEVVPGTTTVGFTPTSAASCAANTRSMFEGTAGFWYKAYSGPKGKILFGPQYSYIRRQTWRGVGGSPNTHENAFWTSFRYYLP
jgi:hypothetical protein